jgi:hypothetical protein
MLCKITPLSISIKLGIPKLPQNHLKVLCMFICCLGILLDIININYLKVIHLFAKDSVHEGYECQGHITQLVRHHKEFIRPIPCMARYLFYVPIRNLSLVVSRLQLNTSKVFCSSQLLKKTINLRQWVVVFYAHLIQSSIVIPHSKLAIILIFKEDRGSI